MTPSSFDDAKSFQLAGEFERAVEGYRAAAEADPGDFRALHNLAVVLQELDRTAEAEAAYERALAANPEVAWTHYNLARLRHLADRPAEAEAGYRRALALDPELAEAYFNLGRLLLERGEPVDAERALREAARLEPGNAGTHSYLGDALFSQRRLHEALAAYRETTGMDPDDPAAAFDEGKTLEFLHRADEAVECYRRSVALDPKGSAPREALARALEAGGRHDEALESLHAWLADDPGNPMAAHLLAALTGAGVPERASDGYVRDTFDRFASDFDQTLARLDYRGPELIAAALALTLGEPSPEHDVLDAGCGTGLCAPFLRGWARRLEGVDLSPAMIERAKRRGGYDALHVAELGDFLSGQESAWDLIVSADTLCYFGAIEGVLGAARRALRTDGVFAFTVERLDGAEGYALGPHGRYAHSPGYVRAALSASGFDAGLGHGVLRQEDGAPVHGLIVMAQRRER